jgi:hypothetical protein
LLTVGATMVVLRFLLAVEFGEATPLCDDESNE